MSMKTSAALCILSVGVMAARSHTLPSPETLGRLALVESVTGEEAKAFVDRLHGKGVTPQNLAMGHYKGEGKKATLYISAYRSNQESSNSLSRMMALIKRGNPAFTHFTGVLHSQTKIGRCLGQGQVHFFFNHQSRVYWLSVDPGEEKASLDGLLTRLHVPPGG